MSNEATNKLETREQVDRRQRRLAADEGHDLHRPPADLVQQALDQGAVQAARPRPSHVAVHAAGVAAPVGLDHQAEGHALPDEALLGQVARLVAGVLALRRRQEGVCEVVLEDPGAGELLDHPPTRTEGRPGVARKAGFPG